MATTQKAFTNRILQIEGVENFILMKEDGDIIAHNINTSQEDPESVSTVVLSTGLHSDNLKSIMGFTHFNCLKIVREKKENIFVFPLKNYFLGIFQDPKNDKNSLTLIKNVTNFIYGVA